MLGRIFKSVAVIAAMVALVACSTVPTAQPSQPPQPSIPSPPGLDAISRFCGAGSLHQGLRGGGNTALQRRGA